MFTEESKLPAIGFGTVEIRTKRSPGRNGRDAHATLKLKNVLHVPSSFRNIIGSPDSFFEDYNVLTNSKGTSKGTIVDHAGRSVAYFDLKQRLFSLKLSGPPVGPRVGPHVWKENTAYFINAHWPESEIAKFLSKHPPAAPSSLRPFTEQERKWLKDNYGGEYRFLRQHGLSIYKGEDREQGREIVRSTMAGDSEQSKSEDEMDDGDYDEDGEWDPEGHFADRFFTASELDFIERTWGNSQVFMESYRLKFYDDEDCREATSLVRTLMGSDQD
jgi:hypothetical protein